MAFESLSFYSYTTKVLLDDLSNIIKTSNGSKTWRYMITYKNLMRAIEALGVEMSYGMIYIGNGKLNVEDFARYVENHYIFEEYVYQSIAFLTEMRQLLGNLKESSEYKQYIARYRVMMTAREFSDVNGTDEIRIYFQNTYQMLETMRHAVDQLRIELEMKVHPKLCNHGEGYWGK